MEASDLSRKEKLKQLPDLLAVAKRTVVYSFHTFPSLTLLSLTITIVSFLFPFLNRWFEKGLIDGLISYTTSSSDIRIILVPFLLLSLGTITHRIIGILETYLSFIYFQNMMEHMTYQMAEKYSSFDLEYYENPESMDLLDRAQRSYSGKPAEFSGRVFSMIGGVVSLITGATILFSLSPLIMSLILISLIPALASDIYFGQRKWSVWNLDAETRRNYGRTLGYLMDEASLLELKVYGVRKYFLLLVKKLYRKFKQREVLVETKRTSMQVVLSIISNLFLVGAVWLIIQDVLKGNITVGSFTFYLSTVNGFINNINGLFWRVTRSFEDSLYLKDLYAVMSLPAKIINGHHKMTLGHKPPEIEFKQVYFKYPGTNKHIFKDLNFKITPGTNLAIVGENGAGKTTLVKLLCRFYDVTRGEILIDGVNIKQLDIKSWYKYIAFLTQDYSKYHFDVQTNIGVGNIDNISDIKAIKKAAKLSGANAFISKFDRGYKQVLSRKFKGGIQLSAGQWQKVALARAFFKNSLVLILDEPTSAIDPKAEYEIFQNIFKKFGQDKSILIISHRFSTVRNAQRIIVLEKGLIIEDGSHEQLMKMSGVYAHAFKLQKQGYED